MTEPERLLRAAFDAAIAAAHPDGALPGRLPPAPRGRLIVLAAGKSAAALAAAAERHYLDEMGLDPARLVGLAVTRHGHGVPTRRVKVIEAGHPVPDAAGLAGAETTLGLASAATADDLVLALVSGGGSANWVAPAAGVEFGAKQAITRALLRSGAGIAEINTVRKHLSRIKGGRLAQAAAPARVVTLAISDVPGDDPAAIASGPTVPDHTTLADARAVLARFGIERIPSIEAALSDTANETPKPGDRVFERCEYSLVARPADSLAAARAVLEQAGYDVVDLGPDVEGEARDVAADHAARALEALAAGRRMALLSGGELTVTIRGSGGRGGPNQEYALALATALAGAPGICAIAGDTDGADGGGGAASDPAGATVTSTTLSRARELGLDPAGFLANNDATTFFEGLGDLVVTGPTLTNVNDLRVILVDPQPVAR